MTWFKIDDSFYDNPKVVDLALETVGLWALTGAYCARHLTDGVLTARTAIRLGATEAMVTELVEAGLWEPFVDDESGKPSFRFHDWDEYQPSRDEKLAEREAGRQRAAESRRRRKEAIEAAKLLEAFGAPQSNVPTNVQEEPPARSPERSPEPPANVRHDVQENEQRTSAGRSAPPTRPDPTRPDHLEEPPAPTARQRHEKLFEEAWADWPKKVDRKDALQKFHTALKQFRGREQELVDAIQAHGKAYAEHNEPKYRPGLAVWLNKERWNNPLPGTPEAGGDTTAPGGPGGPAAPRDPNAWMNPPRRTDRPRTAGDDAA